VAVTWLSHSWLVILLAPGGQKFVEVADIVLGNADPLSDGLVDVPGQANKVGAVSTVTGALLAQATVAEVARQLSEAGRHPRVLWSNERDLSGPTRRPGSVITFGLEPVGRLRCVSHGGGREFLCEGLRGGPSVLDADLRVTFTIAGVQIACGTRARGP
jgi:hypothetical protein